MYLQWVFQQYQPGTCCHGNKDEVDRPVLMNLLVETRNLPVYKKIKRLLFPEMIYRTQVI